MWPTSSSSAGLGLSSERVLSTTGRGKKQGQNLLPGSKKALRNALIKEKRAQRATRSGAGAKGEDGGLGFDVRSLVEDLIKAANQAHLINEIEKVDEGEGAANDNKEESLLEIDEEEDDGPAEEDLVTALGSGAIEAFSTPPLSRYGRQIAFAIGHDFQSFYLTQEIGKGTRRCIVYIPRQEVELKEGLALSSVSISRARQRADEFARQASGEAFDAAVDTAKSLKKDVRDKHSAQKLAEKKFSGKLRKIFVIRSEKKHAEKVEVEGKDTSATILVGVNKLTMTDDIKSEEEEEEMEEEEEVSDDTEEDEIAPGLGSSSFDDSRKVPEWEIYTRGIGSRLLSKMGFTGGPLGVDRGMPRISEPIEATPKNNKKGLGMDL